MSSKACEKGVVDGTALIVHSNNETSQEPENFKLDALALIEEKRQKQTLTSSADAVFKSYVTSDHHASILIQSNFSVFNLIFNRICSSDASKVPGGAAMGNILKNIYTNINSNSGVVRFFKIRKLFDIRRKNTNEEFEEDTSREECILPRKACFIPSEKCPNVLQMADQCRRGRSSVPQLNNRLEFCLSLKSSRAHLDFDITDDYL